MEVHLGGPGTLQGGGDPGLPSRGYSGYTCIGETFGTVDFAGKDLWSGEEIARFLRVVTFLGGKAERLSTVGGLPPESQGVFETPEPEMMGEEEGTFTGEDAPKELEAAGPLSQADTSGQRQSGLRSVENLPHLENATDSAPEGDVEPSLFSGNKKTSPDPELAEACLPEPEPPPITILEGLLFVGDPSQPALTPERLAYILGVPSAPEVEELVGQLNARYERERRPYRVFRESGGYVLRLTAEYAPVAERLRRRVRESRLSQAALEVLAIVAYRQPVTAEEVSRLRGRPSSHLLSQLLQKGLIQASPEPGKPRTLQYRTTSRFEEIFGLQGLEDLPQIGRCEEDAGDGEDSEQG